MYDYIIITHIPNFYKVNLYNELSKKLNILVIFTAKSTSTKRSNDFITLDNIRFEYRLLFNGNYEERNVFTNIMSIKHIFKEYGYKRILVSGWDTKEDWFSILYNSKSKNCLALESTINDSKINGIKGNKQIIKMIDTNPILYKSWKKLKLIPNNKKTIEIKNEKIKPMAEQIINA